MSIHPQKYHLLPRPMALFLREEPWTAKAIHGLLLAGGDENAPEDGPDMDIAQHKMRELEAGGRCSFFVRYPGAPPPTSTVNVQLSLSIVTPKARSYLDAERPHVEAAHWSILSLGIYGDYGDPLYFHEMKVSAWFLDQLRWFIQRLRPPLMFAAEHRMLHAPGLPDPRSRAWPVMYLGPAMTESLTPRLAHLACYWHEYYQDGFWMELDKSPFVRSPGLEKAMRVVGEQLDLERLYSSDAARGSSTSTETARTGLTPAGVVKAAARPRFSKATNAVLHAAVNAALDSLLAKGDAQTASEAAVRHIRTFDQAWMTYRRWQTHVTRGHPDMSLQALLQDIPPDEVWKRAIEWLAIQRRSPGRTVAVLLRHLTPRTDPSPKEALVRMLLARDDEVREAAIGLGQAWAKLDPAAAQQLTRTLLWNHKLPGIHAAAEWLGSVAPRPQEHLAEFFARINTVGAHAQHRLVARLLPASRAGAALRPVLEDLHARLPLGAHTLLAWLAEAWRREEGLEEICRDILAADPAPALADILLQQVNGLHPDTHKLREILASVPPDPLQSALLEIADQLDAPQPTLPPWPEPSRLTMWRMHRLARRDPHQAWEEALATIASQPTLRDRIALALAWRHTIWNVSQAPSRKLRPGSLTDGFLGSIGFEEIRADAPLPRMLKYLVSGLVIGGHARTLATSWISQARFTDQASLQRLAAGAARSVDAETARMLFSTDIWRNRLRPPIVAEPGDVQSWLSCLDRDAPALAARVRTHLVHHDASWSEHVAPDPCVPSFKAHELEAEVLRRQACMDGWPPRAVARQARGIVADDQISPTVKRRIRLGDDLLARAVAAKDPAELEAVAALARAAGDDEVLELVLPQLAGDDPERLREAFDVLVRRVVAGNHVGEVLVHVGLQYLQHPIAEADSVFGTLHAAATTEISGAYPYWFYCLYKMDEPASVRREMWLAARRDMGLDE